MKILVLAAAFLPVLLFAQAELRIGEWRNQIPYNNGASITQSDEAIYYATDLAILKLIKSDLSTQKISTTEGLSGSKINAIYYHQKTKTLVVAYSDGLIDLVTEEKVEAIPFIKIYNNVPIAKTINSITYRNDESVFINADFGLISLNLVNQLVEFTVFTSNIKIKNTISFNNQYLSATSNGVYRFLLNTNNLVEDFTNWQQIGFSEGLDPSENYLQILVHNNLLYILEQEKIYKLNGTQFDVHRTYGEFDFLHGYSDNKDMIFTLNYVPSGENILLVYKNATEWIEYKNECIVASTSSLQEPITNRIWTADPRYGFRYIDDLQACKFINISGPYNNFVFQIKSLQDATYIASGGWDETYTYKFIKDGIYKYKAGDWSFINFSNSEFFKNNNISDILRIEENKQKDKLYFASFQQGLIQYDKIKDEYTLFNDSNTGGELGQAVGDPGKVRISGLDYDVKTEKLWIANYLARKPIVSLDKAGTWKSFSLPVNIGTNIIDITVDQNGYKWLVLRDGLAVFDERNPLDPTDDRTIVLNSSNTNITSNIIYNVTVDLEGDVWVGTAAGPVIFECGGSIFDGICKGTRRKVDQNGIIGFLLETEEVLSVAVDGANRKWIGTRNGLYVQSPSGEFQIDYFNTNNSPLLSNNIFSLSVNEKTGEVWIGTDRGLQVYRSNATFANDNFIETMRINPNPSTADYTGVVAIQGLARDARVKITDISGRLVYETFANGGQATWNRKDYLGNDVASGVYLIFANTTKDFDVSEGSVGKLVVVR
ncbi:MAG: hypothetical protein HOP11_15380 [Saprospiraceae bacterium]|nr:hypothetical protein [Saprospiraceae bacterium]